VVFECDKKQRGGSITGYCRTGDECSEANLKTVTKFNIAIRMVDTDMEKFRFRDEKKIPYQSQNCGSTYVLYRKLTLAQWVGLPVSCVESSC